MCKKTTLSHKIFISPTTLFHSNIKKSNSEIDCLLPGSIINSNHSRIHLSRLRVQGHTRTEELYI